MFDRRRSDELHRRVQDAIASGELDDARFDELAIAIARHQAESSPAIARLFRARGVALESIRSADAIPAVPTDAFKLARVAAHPAADDVRIFHTSGTTVGARGAHALRRTDTYEAAALAFGRAKLFDRFAAPPRIVSLVAPPDVVPDSSLSFMVGLFAARLASSASFHTDAERVDVEGFVRAIASAPPDAPILVLATSFALVHVLDASTREMPLPAGSRVMTTGGFKGRTREVAKDDLLRAIARRFAIAEDDVVSEYGMTELASQAYADGRGPHVAPGWMRVRAVDPETLVPAPRGEVGIARIVDLADVDSAVALQTQDLVREVEGGFELLGRLPGATPRGCSLAIEELIGA